MACVEHSKENSATQGANHTILKRGRYAMARNFFINSSLY